MYCHIVVYKGQFLMKLVHPFLEYQKWRGHLLSARHFWACGSPFFYLRMETDPFPEFLFSSEYEIPDKVQEPNNPLHNLNTHCCQNLQYHKIKHFQTQLYISDQWLTINQNTCNALYIILYTSSINTLHGYQHLYK
jgi:hypothetical protein